MGRRVILPAVCLMLLSCGTPVDVKQWYVQAQLTAGLDAQTASGFAQAVAVSGDYAVVSAYLQDVGIRVDAGAVYIYKRNGTAWTLYQPPLTGVINNDKFGYAVDISGNFIIIGAAGEDAAVYIYENNGTAFVRQQKLTAGTNTAFGTAVAIDGDWAVAGDKLYDWGSTSAPEGAVYVYYKGAGWAEQQKLRTATQADNDHFGAAVAIDGNRIAAGAPRNDSKTSDAGAVYIFERIGVTWGVLANGTENRMLTNPFSRSGDNFGYTVSLAGNQLVAGCTGNGGSALTFEKATDGWQSFGPVTHADITATDLLGYAVCTNGQFVVAGTGGSNAGAVGGGALYIFKPGYRKWEFFSRQTAVDTDANELLGSAVAIDGDYIIGGAPGSLPTYGAAYIYYRDYIQ